MTTLVLISCMIGDPQNCRRDRIPTEGGFATAPQVIAEWAEGHPTFRVISWRVRK